MKKGISIFIIVLVIATIGVLSTGGVIGYAQNESEVSSYEEYLYDFNDNITYLLRYSTSGGYSITHIATGIVCEYDDFNNSPYDGKIGKFYYGGPGAYLSMPLKLVGKITPMQYFGITIEENEQLNTINSSFVEQANAISTFTITSNDGYTLINNYSILTGYTLLGDSNGERCVILMLYFFNDYLGGGYIPVGISASEMTRLVNDYWDNTASGNLNICVALKDCLLNFMNNHSTASNQSVTYTIISPRSEIIARIGSNKPSILVMTNSYSDSKCNVVYGYSGNYYRIRSMSSGSSYNVNRSYVYGGVFLG